MKRVYCGSAGLLAAKDFGRRSNQVRYQDEHEVALLDYVTRRPAMTLDRRTAGIDVVQAVNDVVACNEEAVELVDPGLGHLVVRYAQEVSDAVLEIPGPLVAGLGLGLDVEVGLRRGSAAGL